MLTFEKLYFYRLKKMLCAELPYPKKNTLYLKNADKYDIMLRNHNLPKKSLQKSFASTMVINLGF